MQLKSIRKQQASFINKDIISRKATEANEEILESNNKKNVD